MFVSKGKIVLLLSCISQLTMVQAEVVLDNTLGVVSGSIALDVDQTYVIDADSMGETAGSNAFFSFSEFNVEAGNRAKFTGSNIAYDNFIARVSGNDASLIEGGLISKVTGANLWLMNPNGVVFSRGASVDIAGSLHVSSSDYIRFDDSNSVPFYADTTKPWLATVASPNAFGFSGDIALSDVQVEQARMRVAPGENLSLVGGNVFVDGSVLTAEQGVIQVASIADSGEVVYQDNLIQQVDAANLAKVSIRSSMLDVGDEGGSVQIFAEEITQQPIEQDYAVVELAAVTNAAEAEVNSRTCQPSVYAGALPMVFQVNEKELATHYSIQISQDVSKSDRRKYTGCQAK
jgi:filamentous hemagglutinin family protein